MRQGGFVPAPEESDLLHVRLPSFDGPLDLLLHLVRKHELDINDLRLAELTEPYLAYLERMEVMNLDSAGEFLAIAATLVWIKSKSLLPRELAEEEESDPADQEALLIQRLQDYQRIKDAALALAGLDVLGRDRFARQAARMAGLEGDGEAAPSPEIEGVTLFQLIEAFRAVMERAQEPPALEVAREVERIEDRIEALLHRFQAERTLAFRELFDPRALRQELVLVFIALLELVRLKAIRITQPVSQGEILCSASEEFARSPHEWKTAVMAALTGTPHRPPGDESLPA